MSQKFEYTFFPPNTLTTNETLAVVSKVGHAISQETQSTIRYDRQLNKIEIMSKSEQSLNQAKKRLKEALWKVPEPPTVASARSRAQWSKKDKQEIWANADEHPEPQSKAKMTRIRITPVHTHQIPVRHSYHGEWLQQLATETHCMLDWVDDTNVMVQGFDEDQVQTFLDRLLVITRQLNRKQTKPKMQIIVDLNAIDTTRSKIDWISTDDQVKNSFQLNCRPYLSDPEIIYEAEAVSAANILRQSNLKMAVNWVAQSLDQCRAYAGDLALVLTLGTMWCVIKNPNVMVRKIEQQMDPLKPAQWTLFNKLQFDKCILSETQVIVQRICSIYSLQPVHMPSLLRYELDLEIPAKYFRHIPDEQVLEGTGASSPNRLNSGMIRARLHLYPSAPNPNQENEYEGEVSTEYLDCRKVTCCDADRFELIWLMPGAGFDARIAIESTRVIGHLANPQLTTLLSEVTAALRTKADGSLVLCKKFRDCQVLASRRKEAWIWHGVGNNGEELLLNHISEWTEYKNSSYASEKSYHTLQLCNPKWTAMLAQQPLLPMGEAAHWMGTDFTGKEGEYLINALMILRKLANLVID